MHLVPTSHRRIATTKETADYLGLSPRTLEIWRWKGGGPAYLKLGAAVRYDLNKVDEWTVARTHQNTSEVRV